MFQDPASIQFPTLLFSAVVSQVTPGVFIQPVSEKKEAMERVCLIFDPLFLQGIHVTSVHISLARSLAWPHLDVREAEADVVASQQQFYTVIRTKVSDERLAVSVTTH